jgi:hypothetical protein
VNGTREISHQGHIRRSPSTRIALVLSAGPSLWGSRGALCRTCALPGNAFPNIFPLRYAPHSNLDWPSLPVAYCVLAISRLGCSPNLGFNTAYHTTFYKSQGSTNQCL